MNISAPMPHLVVSDGNAAIAFYRHAFQAEVTEKHLAEDGRRILHAKLRIGSGGIMLHDDFPEFGGSGSARSPAMLGGVSCVFHVDVPDADATWQKVLDAGAEVLVPLDNQPWNMRYGQVRDPFGHVWSIGGPVPREAS